MRIVNPNFGLSQEEGTTAGSAGSRVNWLQDPIVFFSNSKPNIKELMDGLRSKLSTLRKSEGVDFIAKPSAGVAAPAEMMDLVASKYRIAILGSAD
jgi:hypothetical protein